MSRTRLAPSPTGALHLGNARTFLITWALARQNGWNILLRIEDLDGPRVKPDSAAQAIDDLRWLGIDWDEGPVYQRNDLTPYQDALRRLAAGGWAYPCDCTRQQIQAATLSAPHGDEHELRYPGTCRPNRLAPRELTETDFSRAWRLVVPEHRIRVADKFHGLREFDVHGSTGDFLIWTKQGLPSYQLAVVVDDARQGIDQVIRGDDLLSSAARQQSLYDRLGLGAYPGYTHLPLVIGPDGRRLAKRHGDSRIAKYRDAGVPAARVLGLLARWCGLDDVQEITAAEFLCAFDLSRLSNDPLTFQPNDEAWLTSARCG
jgi:glutamyl-tRNA synthetase